MGLKMGSKSFFKVPMRVLKKYSVPPNHPSLKSWGELRAYARNCMKGKVGDLIWNYKDQTWSEVIEIYVSWYCAYKLYDSEDPFFSKVRLMSKFKYPDVLARIKCREYDDGLIVHEIIRKDQE